MAEEIEQELLARIGNAIDEAKATEQSPLARLLPQGTLPTQFSDLKDDLLKSKASPSLRRVKLYQLYNLLSQWLVLKNQSPYSPESLAFSIKLSRSLKRIKKELTGRDGSVVADATGPSQLVGQNASALEKLETYRWSYKSVDAAKVHGLDNEVKCLERLLVRPESCNGFGAIGIVGIGGVGKTTLCQLFLHNEQVKKRFLPRIWVCMSRQPNQEADDRKEIVKRMLTCVGVEEETIRSADHNHGLAGLLYALRLSLMGKRYLIVLDDAWSSDQCYNNLDSCLSHGDEKWSERLAYGLPKGYGGTVMVTSRAEDVAGNMVGWENLRPLGPLADRESCWLIFKDSVEGDGVELPQDLEILKEEMVNRCAGLPLSAKLMGQIVHQQLLSKSVGPHNHQEP